LLVGPPMPGSLAGGTAGSLLEGPLPPLPTGRVVGPPGAGRVVGPPPGAGRVSGVEKDGRWTLPGSVATLSPLKPGEGRVEGPAKPPPLPPGAGLVLGPLKLGISGAGRVAGRCWGISGRGAGRC
jgi:hypothetical protein